MSPPVTLARLRWWHLDAVLALEARLFPDEPWGPRGFWSELGRPDTRYYLAALREGELLGYAGLCDYPDEAFVQTMAVAPAAQGHGVGARLLRALLEEADRRGHRTVSLEVRADNAPAQRLYARHGFGRRGVRRGYYRGADGSRVDAWEMSRRASPGSAACPGP